MGGFRFAGAPTGAVHGPPLTPPHPGAALQPRPHGHAGIECADDTGGSRIEYRRPPPRRGAGGRGAPHTPSPPPARKPRGPRPPAPEAGGMVLPCPREEPERDPPPRPSRRLARGPRRTSEPAPTRQDAAQMAPREGGRAGTGVVWGATPPMDSTTPVTPALLPAQGRQRDDARQSDSPPYRPPPAAQTGGTAHAPPPQPAPRHTNATDPPRGVQPPQVVQAEGTEKGPHTRTPAPTTRGSRTPTARPVGGQSGEPSRGEPVPDPPPQAGQTEQGTGAGHAEGHGPRRTALPAPSAGTTRGSHATPPRGGGADAAGARAHTHVKGTRGLPEGQPDRARGTHRPRGMAYQRARVRDTRTGRPATRSAEHAGREGGNERDTTPGTGPNPPNRPRAPRRHRRGTAPAKAVVAHSATPQPLG